MKKKVIFRNKTKRTFFFAKAQNKNLNTNDNICEDSLEDSKTKTELSFNYYRKTKRKI